MNARIVNGQDEEKKRCHCHVVAEISHDEFWKYWGITLLARIYGRKGDLWDNTSEQPEGWTNIVDVSDIMSKERFSQIRWYIPYLFTCPGAKSKGDDLWWQIRGGVNGFNSNRSETIQAAHEKVLDEFMSAYAPQTRKIGNLPHLSFIARKPEPLGTEFKCVADPFC